MKKIGLLPRLILGIVLGILVGFISRSTEVYSIARIFITFSDIFANFLKFIIPCIIVGFVAPSIAELGGKSGKLLAITAGIAYISTVLSGIAAFFVGSLILPKVIKVIAITGKSQMKIDPYFTIKIDPLMGVMTALVLAFMLGIGMAHIKGKNLLSIMGDFQDIVSLTVKKIIIPFVPLYITGIFVKLTILGEIFKTLKTFSSVYAILLVLQIVYVIIQYGLAFMLSSKNPFKCLKNMMPSYFTALGTQSSAAAIPVNLECIKKNGVSDEISDFVVPLCATIHLAGDTITLVLASMGVMLINGQSPTIGVMMSFIFMLGITMVAAPGIPGGGVMAALGLLQDMLMFGASQQGLMIALHAAQDSFGTATNVIGDGAIAIIVDYIANKRKNNQRL